jgi:DNA-binding MarR family transcriptional regulator
VSEDGHHYAATEGMPPGVDLVSCRAVESFFVLFARMSRYYSATCESFDLTPQLGTVVRGLVSPSPMRELARELHLDASNLTGLVDRLEQRGLVERRPDPADRRVKQLVLTARGTALRDALNTRLMSDPPLLAGLDEDQRTDLCALLSRAAAATAGGHAP